MAPWYSIALHQRFDLGFICGLLHYRILGRVRALVRYTGLLDVVSWDVNVSQCAPVYPLVSNVAGTAEPSNIAVEVTITESHRIARSGVRFRGEH
jgi:hypothetical protein